MAPTQAWTSRSCFIESVKSNRLASLGRRRVVDVSSGVVSVRCRRRSVMRHRGVAALSLDRRVVFRLRGSDVRLYTLRDGALWFCALRYGCLRRLKWRSVSVVSRERGGDVGIFRVFSSYNSYFVRCRRLYSFSSIVFALSS